MLQNIRLSPNAHESFGDLKGAAPTQRCRPLDVSHFVCEEMPEVLRKIREGVLNVTTLREIVSAHCTSPALQRDFAALLSSNDLSLQRVGLLDLTMLQSGIALSGGELPAELTTLVDLLAEQLGVPPVLTYGLIVRDNAQNTTDMRTFCAGHVGSIERNFYLWPRENRGSPSASRRFGTFCTNQLH